LEECGVGGFRVMFGGGVGGYRKVVGRWWLGVN